MEEDIWRRRWSAAVFVSGFLGRKDAGTGAAVAVGGAAAAGSFAGERGDLNDARTAHIHMRKE